jgi:hypothetical protein
VLGRCGQTASYGGTALDNHSADGTFLQMLSALYAAEKEIIKVSQVHLLD